MNVLGQKVVQSTRCWCEETDFDELQPGDRIKVECCEVLDDAADWRDVVGTVLRTEHRTHRPHLPEEKAACRPDDLILLETPTGELLVVTVGRATVVRRA